MSKIFPPIITALPEINNSADGVEAYLSQGAGHQIVFMEFDKDIDLEEHSHESQWTVVLEGKIDLIINRVSGTYYKGDRYYIPKGVKHSGRIYAGYSDMTFYSQEK
ncbi:MAG: cupin domain-containing protein [Tannerellaceae bacterium]|nr:cupin domain-containing protein [Tannerellaceae bacterium]